MRCSRAICVPPHRRVRCTAGAFWCRSRASPDPHGAERVAAQHAPARRDRRPARRLHQAVAKALGKRLTDPNRSAMTAVDMTTPQPRGVPFSLVFTGTVSSQLDTAAEDAAVQARSTLIRQRLDAMLVAGPRAAGRPRERAGAAPAAARRSARTWATDCCSWVRGSERDAQAVRRPAAAPARRRAGPAHRGGAAGAAAEADRPGPPHHGRERRARRGGRGRSGRLRSTLGELRSALGERRKSLEAAGDKGAGAVQAVSGRSRAADRRERGARPRARAAARAATDAAAEAERFVSRAGRPDHREHIALNRHASRLQCCSPRSSSRTSARAEALVPPPSAASSSRRSAVATTPIAGCARA